MKNEFIPYEQALTLKELGFDEPCFAMWTTGLSEFESSNVSPPRIFSSKFKLNDNQSYTTYVNNLKYFGISAPLYQQAFRWFREKYRLEIIFKPDSFNHENKKLREYVIISYDKTWKLEEISEPSHWIRKGCFKTYEEAELECLKKLIGIVKTKKIKL